MGLAAQHVRSFGFRTQFRFPTVNWIGLYWLSGKRANQVVYLV